MLKKLYLYEHFSSKFFFFLYRETFRTQILHPCQIILEMTLPGSIVLVQGIDKGALRGDGEMLSIGHTGFLTALDQLIEVVIGAVGGDQHVVVDHQVIAGPVGHQQITVGIQNIAPGRLDAGVGCKGCGIIRLAAGLYDLQIIQLEAEEQHHHRKKQNYDLCSKTGYSLHMSPPPMALSTG